MQNTVGMIGLGIMGSAMASNLVKAGFRVIGYDVASKARAAHRRAGGIVARSGRDVAAAASEIESVISAFIQPSSAEMRARRPQLQSKPAGKLML